MARSFTIPGECLVSVRGNVNSSIAALTQLGLTAQGVTVTPTWRLKPITLDAYANEVPIDMQYMLAYVTINMNLIHFDEAVLEACINESMGGASAYGTTVRAGTRLGGGVARFAAGNHLMGLNLSSPIAGLPYRFLYSFIDGHANFPIGVDVQTVSLSWRAIPYQIDPYNAGAGAGGVVIWDRLTD